MPAVMADAPAAEPIRFYADEDRRLPDRVSRQLVGYRQTLRDALVGGYATDWADYKHRVGFIAGIDHALSICAEAEKELSGD